MVYLYNSPILNKITGKPTTKLPSVNVSFAEDKALPSVNINKPIIPLETKIPGFNQEPALEFTAYNFNSNFTVTYLKRARDCRGK